MQVLTPIIPPATRFEHVFRLETPQFLERQDAFVVAVVNVLAAIPIDELPDGELMFEDFRADAKFDGYLRLFAGKDGRATTLVEVMSRRQSRWFQGQWFEVRANLWLRDDALVAALAALRTGDGLPTPSDGNDTLLRLARAWPGRHVYSNDPESRVELR